MTTPEQAPADQVMEALQSAHAALIELRKRFHSAVRAGGSSEEYVILSTPGADEAITKAAAALSQSTPRKVRETCSGCEGKPAPENNPCAVCGKPAPDEGVVQAPWEPSEGQWGKLARSIMMWLDMGNRTPRVLFKHLERTGVECPDWLRDEPEMKHLDHVPSKGTRCVLIYKAMLAPVRLSTTAGEK